MHAFILALAFTVASPIRTVTPTRTAHFREHKSDAPVMRYTWEVIQPGGCVTRTLAGDASGQTVKYCAK